MNKDIYVTVRGSHRIGDGEDVVESTSDGHYLRRDDTDYITYSETDENGMETKTLLKIRPGYVQVTRKGAVSTSMELEQGKDHDSLYATGFGCVRITTKTKRVVVMRSDERISVSAEYVLAQDGQTVSRCRLDIKVAQKAEQ